MAVANIEARGFGAVSDGDPSRPDQVLHSNDAFRVRFGILADG